MIDFIQSGFILDIALVLLFIWIFRDQLRWLINKFLDKKK